MKYFSWILLLTAFLPLTIVTAAENKTPSSQEISVHRKDITGNGQNEKIQLIGQPFSAESNYYVTIWAAIADPNNKKWKIPYNGGYDPKIKFIDLNHDNIQDLFYQSSTGGSGGLYNYYLHTLENGKVSELKLPEQQFITGEFKDDFKVEIQLSPEDEPITIDTENHAAEYIQLKIYNKSGEVIKNKSVMVNPIAFFEPVKINEQKGYGLKSYQQISGAYHADLLGTVETMWYFEKDKWTILKTEWVPANEPR